MTKRSKNIVGIIVLIVIIGMVYLFITRPTVVEETLQSASGLNPLANQSQVEAADVNDLLALLSSLKQIELNTELFQSEEFRVLEDFSLTLLPEGNEGRVNPFAPIGVEQSIFLGNTIPDPLEQS